MHKFLSKTIAAVAIAAALMALPGSAAAQGEAKSNQFWWPENLSLKPLRDHGLDGLLKICLIWRIGSSVVAAPGTLEQVAQHRDRIV